MYRIYVVIGYVVVSLISGGYIYLCFTFLFPILGRWIVDLNYKLQDKMRSDGQRHRRWLNRILKLKMDENDIKECYEKNGFPKTVKKD